MEEGTEGEARGVGVKKVERRGRGVEEEKKRREEATRSGGRCMEEVRKDRGVGLRQEKKKRSR